MLHLTLTSGTNWHHAGVLDPGSRPHDEHAIDAVVLNRRSCLRLDADLPVDAGTIAELCRLATWAPNHHHTEPWRFAVFTGDGRRALGDTIAAAMAARDAPAAKVAKTRVKYLRAPVMVVVGTATHEDPVTARENRDAVAAAIQTLLLAATARGLGSFWSSVATPDDPALLELCGFEPDATAHAAIYLGHPIGTCPPPQRTGPRVRWVG